jgi:ubiquinone/menaquinone biosynthesis C-methylase UbiE
MAERAVEAGSGEQSVPAPGVDNRIVAATYDRFARAYDWLVSPLARGTRGPALDLLDPAPGERVLELGCGPGHALVDLGERVGPAGRAVGLDAAPGMVERARRRVASGGLAGRAGVVLGDARNLPVADGTVDAVFVEDTLELFDPDDRERVLSEVRRVLGGDGRLGVVTMERSGAEDSAFVRAYDRAFEHLPGYDRFGCRPVYARDALAAAGFTVEAAEHHRRAFVWPVDVILATPARS